MNGILYKCYDPSDPFFARTTFSKERADYFRSEGYTIVEQAFYFSVGPEGIRCGQKSS